MIKKQTLELLKKKDTSILKELMCLIYSLWQ